DLLVLSFTQADPERTSLLGRNSSCRLGNSGCENRRRQCRSREEFQRAPRGPYSALAATAEEVTGPADVVGRARHLGHQLLGSEVLQVRRCGAVAQGLQRVVDGPHGCLEGLVAL